MNVFELFGTIAVDNSAAVAAVKQTAKEAGGLGNAFSKSEKSAGNSLAQIAAANGKTVNEIRSEVMKVAAEYKKQGMSSSEAMRKAYEDIGYSAEKAHDKMDKNMDDSADKTEQFANKMTSIFKKLGTVIVTALAVDKIKDFGKACTEAYASIAAEESAFAQIMGEYADTAQKKLEAVSDATGVSATRMTTHMTALTAKFKGLGYNVEDATTLASDGLLIAADAAAFWDMSLDESMSHLNSFINGSYEGGEAIGLFANDTQMAAYAIEKGIVADTKAWAALDEATKQATRLDYAKTMMEQSGATGQAAKEAGAYANVMAELKEAWRQFQGVIGKPILEKLVLPAMQKLIKFMPGLTEAVQGGIDWLLEAFDKVAVFFSEVFTEDGLNLDALYAAFAKKFRDIARAVPQWLISVGRTLKNAWTNIVWPAVQGVAAKIGIDLPEWSEIEKTVTDWWDGGNGIKQELANVCNWVLNMFDAPADVTAEEVSDVLDSWWTSTKKFVQDTCTWVLQLFQNPEEKMDQVQEKIKEWWGTACGWVASACNWALNLFGVPQAKADAVRNLVYGWWIGMKGAAQSAAEWTLQLFQNPKETMKEVQSKIKEWWKTACGWVQSACVWTLQLFGFEKGAAIEAVAKVVAWFDNVKRVTKDALKLVFDWASGKTPEELKDDVEKVFKDAKNLITEAFVFVWNLIPSDLQDTISGLIGSLKTFWNENKDGITGIFDSKNGLLATFLTGISDMLSDSEFGAAITTAISAFLGAIQTIADALFTEEGKDTIAALLGLLVSVLNLIHPVLGLIQPVLDALEWPIRIISSVIEAIADALAWLTGERDPVTQGTLDQQAQDYDRMKYGGYQGVVEAMGDLSDMSVDGRENETEEYVSSKAGSFTGLSRDTLALIETFWDDYKGYKENGYAYEQTQAEDDIVDALWDALYADYAGQGNEDGQAGRMANNTLEALAKYMSLLPISWENLPSEWFGDDNGGGGGGGNSGMVDGLYTRGSGLPVPDQSNAMLTAMMQAFATVKDDVVAATQEGVVNGLSGVTITGHITTGDVKLNDNAIIGSIWPKLDLKLGWATGMQGRG